MGQIREVTVPDIGDFKDVPIIEIVVKVGDRVKAEAPLITLESDKASMEVPSPSAGLVKSLAVKVGDKVSQGAPILTLELDDAGAADQPAKPAVTPPPAPATAPSGVAEVRVPDIGDFKDVPIIEIAVKPGDAVKPEQPLITLESDKASMEVPSPFGGTVAELKVKIGDRVSEGAVILTLTTEAGSAAPLEKIAASPPAAARSATATPAAPTVSTTPAKAPPDAAFDIPYAGPSVRKLARERGIDLHEVKGSGRRGRILPEDVMNFSAAPAPAAAVSGPPAQGGGLGLLPWPKVDFAKFGPIEIKPLSRIKKISGPTLHRNWVMIPHVTNHDECDITELEEFRKRLNKENEKSGVRVSMLAFMIKAAVASLKRFPEFNASLEGDNLILKKYYHIGFAADTPQGLGRARSSATPTRRALSTSLRRWSISPSLRATASSSPTRCRAAVSRSPASAVSAEPISRRLSMRRRLPSWAPAVPSRSRSGTASSSRRDFISRCRCRGITASSTGPPRRASMPTSEASLPTCGAPSYRE